MNKNHEWHLVGRTGNPVPGDPQEVARMAARYGALSASFERLASIARRMRDDGGLKGEWANALFSQADSSLGKDFPAWAAAFAQAKSELAAWSQELDGFQTGVDKAMRMAEDASVDMQRASRYAGEAEEALSQVQGKACLTRLNPLSTEAEKLLAHRTVETAEDDLAAYQAKAREAQEAISQQKTTIDALIEEYNQTGKRHAAVLTGMDMPGIRELESFPYAWAWGTIEEDLKTSSVALSIGSLLFPGIGWFAGKGRGGARSQGLWSLTKAMGSEAPSSEFLCESAFSLLTVLPDPGEKGVPARAKVQAASFGLPKDRAAYGASEGISAAFGLGSEHASGADQEHLAHGTDDQDLVPAQAPADSVFGGGFRIFSEAGDLSLSPDQAEGLWSQAADSVRRCRVPGRGQEAQDSVRVSGHDPSQLDRYVERMKRQLPSC